MSHHFKADGRKAQELTEQAIAQGRFSRSAKTLCTNCREWANSILHIEGRKELCAKCAWKGGCINEVIAFKCGVIDRDMFDRIQRTKARGGYWQ